MATNNLQSTNRVAHAKVRETTFGLIPTNPAFKAMRVTSSSLSAGPQTTTSDEIRGDRQITDLILVGEQAQGSVGAELSFNTADDDLEEALQGQWNNNPNVVVATPGVEISAVSANTITVAAGLGAGFIASMIVLVQGFPTASNNKLAAVSGSSANAITFPGGTFTAETAQVPAGASVRVVGFQAAAGDLAAVVAPAAGLTSTALDFTTLGLLPGEWIKFGSGAASFGNVAVNNDWVRIATVAPHLLTFDRVPAGWAADSGAGVSLIFWMGDLLRNGVTKRSNTIERQYLDHVPVDYEYLRGMTLNKYDLTFAAQKIVTASADYMGRDGVITQARPGGTSDIPPTSTDVLNTSTNVGRVGFGGSVVSGPNYVMEASLSFNNNLRMQNAVGSVGAVGTGNGEFAVTGTLNTYFGDATVYQAVLNNTALSFDIRVGRGDGNKPTMLFDLPRIKLASGAPTVTGKNGDVMMNAGFQAIRDPVLGYTAHIGRYWYVN